mmetsp:Transcript_23434/g.62955  ORF Transcript_23434/g.62955 Transcript_23434/m.62955 type:complete len:475 (+) Transcript_23434:127-1551(+)
MDVEQLRTEPESFQDSCPDLHMFLRGGWSDERRAALLRVLTAYTFRNPVPGYSQGMNMIAAVLLRAADGNEEITFWLLCSLIENIRDRDFYNEGPACMNGYEAESHVAGVIATKMFEGHNNLDPGLLTMLIQILAPKALIPLYVNLLPVDCLLCVWDRVFSSDGGVWPTYALVAILVANAEVMEAAVMDEMGDAYESVLDHTRNHLKTREFIAALDEVGGANTVKDVDNMRHSHKVEMASEFSVAQSHQFQKLQRTTDFSVKEVISLLEHYKLTVQDADGMSKTQFMELMRLCGVTISDDFFHELFTWVDQDQTGTVDFRELVSVLSVVAHGSDEEKLLLVFAVFDKNRSGFLEPDSMRTLVKSMIPTIAPKGSEIRLRFEQLSAAREPHGVSRHDFLDNAGSDMALMESLGLTSQIVLPPNPLDTGYTFLGFCVTPASRSYSYEDQSVAGLDEDDQVALRDLGFGGFIACAGS